MKRYRFRLASVLRVREIHEDLALAALDAARRSETDATARLEAAAAVPRVPGDLSITSASAVRAQRWRHENAADGVQQGRLMLAAAMDQVEQRRSDLAAAAAKVRGLENLRDRQRAEYLREVIRDEDLDNDERVSRRQFSRAADGRH
jgi:flagellar export protein FliJ